MEDLSLHILDIAENSVSAGARTVAILIMEDCAQDLLSIEIRDDGAGMDSEVAKRAADPFYTTRTSRRVGLGLALLRDAAVAANGALEVTSAPGAGTTVRATFRRSHIDTKPLGNMPETIVALLAFAAAIDVCYRHVRNGREMRFDTKEIRAQLAGASLNSVEALTAVREYLDREEHALAH
jgi:hypothetical protein